MKVVIGMIATLALEQAVSDAEYMLKIVRMDNDEATIVIAERILESARLRLMMIQESEFEWTDLTITTKEIA